MTRPTPSCNVDCLIVLIFVLVITAALVLIPGCAAAKPKPIDVPQYESGVGAIGAAEAQRKTMLQIFTEIYERSK
jgi:NADH:ubiquinone oxidoreductase subunit 3 (subunit A)